MDNNDYYYYKYLKYKQKYEVLKNELEGGGRVFGLKLENWFNIKKDTKNKSKKLIIGYDDIVLKCEDLVTFILNIMDDKDFNKILNINNTVYIKDLNKNFIDQHKTQIANVLSNKSRDYFINKNEIILLDKLHKLDKLDKLDMNIGKIIIKSNITKQSDDIYIAGNTENLKQFRTNYLLHRPLPPLPPPPPPPPRRNITFHPLPLPPLPPRPLPLLPPPPPPPPRRNITFHPLPLPPSHNARLFFDFDKTLVTKHTTGGYDSIINEISHTEIHHIVKILTTPAYKMENNIYNIHNNIYIITRGSHEIICNYLHKLFSSKGPIKNNDNMREFVINYIIDDKSYHRKIIVYGANDDKEMNYNASNLYYKLIVNSVNRSLYPTDIKIDNYTKIWAYIKTLFIENIIYNITDNTLPGTHNIFFDDTKENIVIANQVLNSIKPSNNFYGVNLIKDDEKAELKFYMDSFIKYKNLTQTPHNK